MGLDSMRRTPSKVCRAPSDEPLIQSKPWHRPRRWSPPAVQGLRHGPRQRGGARSGRGAGRLSHQCNVPLRAAGKLDTTTLNIPLVLFTLSIQWQRGYLAHPTERAGIPIGHGRQPWHRWSRTMTTRAPDCDIKLDPANENARSGLTVSAKPASGAAPLLARLVHDVGPDRPVACLPCNPFVSLDGVAKKVGALGVERHGEAFIVAPGREGALATLLVELDAEAVLMAFGGKERITGRQSALVEVCSLGPVSGRHRSSDALRREPRVVGRVRGPGHRAHLLRPRATALRLAAVGTRNARMMLTGKECELVWASGKGRHRGCREVTAIATEPPPQLSARNSRPRIGPSVRGGPS